MQTAVTQPAAVHEMKSRWLLAYAWLAAVIGYYIAVLLAEERAVLWVNDIAWTVTSGCAAFVCLRSARRMEPARRRAWRLLGAGCLSWFIGQLHWDYSQLVLGVDLPFPSIGQLFYSALSMFAIAAALQMPESREPAPFTFRHVGNIGLVSCCLVVTIVLGILEPALQSGVPASYLWIALVHTLLVAMTFLTTLYALWTYRWSSGWTPMLLLVLGLGIYAVANLIYAHALLTGSYLPSDLINASWLVTFGCIAGAAREQVWLSRYERNEPPQSMVARERWLEAVVPALLIIIMVIVAVSSSTVLTARVVA